MTALMYVVATIGILASYLPIMYWKAWVATTMWRWFVLPLWPAAPEVVVSQMVGLILLVHLLFRGPSGRDMTKDSISGQEIVMSYVAGIAFPMIALAFAALVKFWFM